MNPGQRCSVRVAGRHEPQVANQLSHPPRGGTPDDFVRGTGLQQAAAVNHSEPVGERLRLGKLVRYQHRRHLPCGDELADQAGEQPPKAGIQPGVGLIEQQRVAVREQQPPECDPVRLAAR